MSINLSLCVCVYVTLGWCCSFLGRLCELLLLLHVEHQPEAVGKLRQLTDTFFLEWLCGNLHYLVDHNSQFTKLGKVCGGGGFEVVVECVWCSAAVADPQGELSATGLLSRSGGRGSGLGAVVHSATGQWACPLPLASQHSMFCTGEEQ